MAAEELAPLPTCPGNFVGSTHGGCNRRWAAHTREQTDELLVCGSSKSQFTLRWTEDKRHLLRICPGGTKGIPGDRLRPDEPPASSASITVLRMSKRKLEACANAQQDLIPRARASSVHTKSGRRAGRMRLPRAPCADLELLTCWEARKMWGRHEISAENTSMEGMGLWSRTAFWGNKLNTVAEKPIKKRGIMAECGVCGVRSAEG